jgi:hypothetical protein
MRGGPETVSTKAGPRVRIHLPPAGSQERTPHRRCTIGSQEFHHAAGRGPRRGRHRDRERRAPQGQQTPSDRHPARPKAISTTSTWRCRQAPLSGFGASMAKRPNRDGCRGQRNRWIPASWDIKRGGLPSSWRTPAVVVCRIRSLHLSRSCGRRPKLGNKHQDVPEHEPRHGDLRHPERHVTAMADDLRANLDQLLPQARQ